MDVAPKAIYGTGIGIGQKSPGRAMLRAPPVLIIDISQTVVKICIFSGVHKELPPEGPSTNSHRGEAIRMHVARMSLVVLEER